VQLLRAVAALLVVLFHGQQAFATRVSPPSYENETYLFGFGAVGVHIFFVISGFIMVYTSRFDQGFSAASFYRRRLLRIYPIYWLCAALYFLVHGILGAPYDLPLQSLAGAILLLPGDAPLIIGPAWTLTFELFFYFCFGLAMKAGLERGLLLLAGTFVCAITIGLAFPVQSPWWGLATNTLLLEFIAGTAIGWAVVRQKLPRRGGRVVILGAVALFAAGIMADYTQVPTVIIWGVPSALLVLGAVMHEVNVGSGRAARWLGRFGDSSYALYLIHILIVTLALHLTTGRSGDMTVEPAIASFLIAVVALTVAELLHRGVERPTLARLNPKRPLVPVRR
jgi:exopolysaccharide production protein ExoZ